MRPVRRGAQPENLTITQYDDAKPALTERMGEYCSYCERRIPSNLAVEHILPKDIYPEFRNTWHNFLLACVSCNSAKSITDPSLDKVYLPDRDNTFYAFEYHSDGTIHPNANLENLVQQNIAQNTIRWMNLNANDTPARQQKRRQIENCWKEAKTVLDQYQSTPQNAKHIVQSIIIKLALAKGHFSIWMHVFSSYDEVRWAIVNAYQGTYESGCFANRTSALPLTQPITPAPNPDRLPHGGKI